MFFIHYFLQTKHNFSILFSFIVVVGPIYCESMKEFNENMEKTPFLNEHHYSNNLLFPNQNVSVSEFSDRQIYLQREMLQADE